MFVSKCLLVKIVEKDRISETFLYSFIIFIMCYFFLVGKTLGLMTIRKLLIMLITRVPTGWQLFLLSLTLYKVNLDLFNLPGGVFTPFSEKWFCSVEFGALENVRKIFNFKYFLVKISYLFEFSFLSKYLFRC